MAVKILETILKICALPSSSAAEKSYGSDQVVFEGDSDYNHITIRREGGCLTMYFGSAEEEAETSISLAQPHSEAVFEYPGMMLASLPLFPGAKEVVMVGLGGGFLAGIFAKFLPNYQLTVVEIDPLVVELAEIYFACPTTGNVAIKVADGRRYIEEHAPSSLEHLWLDAFNGQYIPAELRGGEFLQLCYDRLKPGGLLVQNLHQSRVQAYQEQLESTTDVFKSFWALEGERSGNTVVIAQKTFSEGGRAPLWSKAELSKAAHTFGPRLGPYDLVSEWRKLV